MKIRLLFLLLMVHPVNTMRPPSLPSSPTPMTERKSSEIVPYIEQLKIAISTMAAPEDIREIIEEIQKISRGFSKYPLEKKRASQIIMREKAFLLGHAKSVADIYNTQVKFLTEHNKPIPEDLKKKHANAYINLELIQQFIVPLDQN